MEINLVTGGYGFIGNYLVRRLLDRGEEVIVMGRSGNTSYIRDLLDRVTVVKCDFSDAEAVRDVIKSRSVTNVFHLGAITPPAAEVDILNTLRINFTGTVNILECARELGVQKVVYASTIGVYGSDSAPEVDDDYLQRPSHVYGMSKTCTERAGEQYFSRYGVDFRGIRLPAIIGAGRWAVGPGDYCERAIGEALNGRPYELNAEPITRLPSAVYVKDVADGFIALRDADGSRLGHRTYNIHGFTVMADELVAAIREFIPDARLSYGPNGHEMTEAFKTWPKFIDDNARNDWGWSPSVINARDFVRDCVKEGTERPYLYRKDED